MRGYARITLAMLCALVPGACGAASGGAQAYPQGWSQEKTAAGSVWTDPADPRRKFTSRAVKSEGGTLADLGAKVTIDTLLSHKGAKLLKAVPYPGCPGEAGLQTFILESGAGRDVLRIAYGNWSGNTVIAMYQRPSAGPDDPAAVAALTRAVCSAFEGLPSLPPAAD